MAETQKAKIERLEREKQELMGFLAEQDNKIAALQDALNKSFKEAPEYIQMKRDLDTQTEAAKTYEKRLRTSEEIRDQQAAKLQEFQKLNNEQNARNPRGAGRKPKLSAEETQRILDMRKEDMTIKAIAERIGCSVGLVFNILKAASGKE